MVLVRAATTAVSALPGEVNATGAALVGEVRSARQEVVTASERQVAALRIGVLAEAGEIRLAADRRVGDTLARADIALGTAEELRQDMKPVLDAAQATLHDTDRTVADLHPQLLGLVAASKVTAGETAQTMRDVRNAVPGFLTQWQAIGDNFRLTTVDFRETAHQSALASAATAHTMANFAAASKPLPTWLRITLGIGPPLAQMGAATVGAGTLLGWFK